MFRRRPPPPVDRAKAFQNVRVLHFSFIMAPLIYIVVGEVMRFIDDKFTDGYGNFGGALWPVRAALLLWWLISTLIAQQVATDDRFVQSILQRGSEITEEAVAGAMQTATIVRLALVGSVSTLGLVVYVENAYRLDLYLFMGLTVLSLLFLRPTREKWDEVFRRVEVQFPALSSSPWAPPS